LAGDNRGVSESAALVARRLIEMFNRNFGQGRFEVDGVGP
jgi:hypothetical protein